jgi:hypothetical protein
LTENSPALTINFMRKSNSLPNSTITVFLTTLAAAIAAGVSGCSSAPKVPEWTQQPTRQVDGGYIVYIGVGEASNQDRAQFKAEGLALEDLANECTMIPKGTRIEDRFVQKGEHESKAYVKVALEFQECEQARHTNEPVEIQKIASVPFTEQLKKYQDLMETGEMPDKSEVAQVEPPAEMAAPPGRAPGWDDRTHFFVMRQYVAYQKEVVVLAPPNYYATNAPAGKTFAANLQPAADQIHGIQERAPALRTQAWSQVPNRPVVTRPTALAPRSRIAKPVNPPARPREDRGQRKGKARKGRGGRRPHRENN